ncbi:MAG: thioredoxin [Clostridiales bacterium]|nr:thioredoxin [Clostridiales bacterium]
MLNLKSEDLAEVKLSSLGTLLVDFWAPWCGPCRMVAPVLEQLAGELGGQVRVGKINIDDNPEAASKYRVSSIPTMILFKDGKEVARTIGAQPKGALLALINAHK